MASLREIRRKMRAIRATRQVTKAMELVAASKMRRATQSAVTLRHYALTAWNLLEHIADVHPDIHPYLRKRSGGKTLAILFMSDRGLCGSLNALMFRTVLKYIKETTTLPSFETLHFVAVGKKSQQILARNHQTVIAAFPAFSNHPMFRDILPIVTMATESFLNATYDHIVLIYPDFVSALVQEPVVKVLLPFSKTDLKEMIGSLLPRKRDSHNLQTRNETRATPREYLFEPSQEDIVQTILPQLTEIQMYQAVLEAAASEHSARMVAMHNATENASDFLLDLTLTFNQTRQANITAELAELSASSAVL